VREALTRFKFNSKSIARTPLRLYRKNVQGNGQRKLRERAKQARKLWIELMLSLLRLGDPDITRLVLEDSVMLSSCLRNLYQDPPVLVEEVITTLRLHVLQSRLVSPAAKTAFFNSHVLSLVVKCCELRIESEASKSQPEKDQQDSETQEDASRERRAAQDAAQQFLSTFAAHSWPRRYRLATLQRLLLTLNLQHIPITLAPLVFSLLRTETLLFAKYFKSLHLSIDPKPTLPWLTNVHLLLQVLGMPLPPASSCTDLIRPGMAPSSHPVQQQQASFLAPAPLHRG